MNLRKLITWLVFALVVLYVINSPHHAAQLVLSTGDSLGSVASAFGFLRRLAGLAARTPSRSLTLTGATKGRRKRRAKGISAHLSRDALERPEGSSPDPPQTRPGMRLPDGPSPSQV